MKEKLKKFINSKLFVFIITALIFSTIGVSAATYFPSNNVTYDNTESGLISTDVQGAIDELYTVCSTPQTPPTSGGTIIENVPIVVSGDGLYADEYEAEKYTYKGTNPNNYITFNGETAGWRIISINPNKTIKIMKNESIGDMAWDSSSNNNWSRPATLNTYLNDNYYDSLSGKSKVQMVESEYYIGGVKQDNNDTLNQILDEKSKTWTGKIGLATLSEYIRANSKTTCDTYYKANNNNDCIKSNWMFSPGDWWTLTPDANTNNTVLYPEWHGYFDSNITGLYIVRPVITISSEVTLNGSGTQSDPYTIE